MSIRTPTPSRVAQPARALTRTLQTLAADGWTVEIVSAQHDGARAFALVARSRLAGADRCVVLHGFDGGVEVRLDDVWKLVAHLNDAQGDNAVLCLAPGAVLTDMARTTAERLRVMVRRIEG